MLKIDDVKHRLCLRFQSHFLNFVFVGIEDILLTPAKICMYLPWKEGILGNVGVS